MHWLDILILVLFCLYTLWSGWSSRKLAAENLEQYFLAGRTLPGWQAGISMAATQFAADTPLLVTGLVAVGGIFALWRLWIYALSFLMIGYLLSACWRRANVITDAELVEIRYSGKMATFLRGFKAIYLGTLFNITVLAMVLLAATRILEPFLVWHAWLPSMFFQPVLHLVSWWGQPMTLSTVPGDPMVWVHTADNFISLLLIAGMTLLYSTTGGLRSVVKTDIMQFTLMMLATACFAWLVVTHAGGIDGIIHRLSAIYTPESPMRYSQLVAFVPSQAKDAGFFLLLVLALQWLAQINADGSGYLAQRLMACRSETDGRQATVVFTIAQILLRSLIWLPLVLGLLALFPPDLSLPPEVYAATAESTYVYGMVALLPAGLKGLMLTGMLGALASTVDTHLNWGASYWTHDLYQRFWCRAITRREPNQRTLIWVARLSNIIILSAAFILMTQLTSIRTAWQMSLLFGAGLGLPLILRWVWWRFNAAAELAALFMSILSVPCLMWVLPGNENDGLRLLLLVCLTTAASLAACFLLPAEPSSTLQRFYERVHPPGFWKPVAHLSDQPTGSARHSRYLFYQALGLTFATALTLFCFLVGIGSFMFQSPPPQWFPWPPAWWNISLLGAGLLCIPFWIGRLKKHNTSV